MRYILYPLVGLIFISTASICKAQITVDVIKGWPYFISCIDTFFGYYYSDDYLCTIKDSANDVVIFKETFSFYSDEIGYNIANITDSTPTQYQVIHKTLENVTMGNTTLTLQVSDFQQVSCHERISMQANIFDPMFPVSVGGQRELTCEEAANGDYYDEVFNPEANIEQGLYEVNWYHDCADLKVNSSKLLLENITLERHPGIYTCSVTYRGMERFVISYKLCVNEVIADVTVDALQGWPLIFSCVDVLYQFPFLDSDTVTCHISDLDTNTSIFEKKMTASDITLANLRFNTGDVNETSSRRYSITVKIDSGDSAETKIQNVTLNVIPFVQSTCEAEPNMEHGFFEVSFTERKRRSISCAEVDGYDPQQEIESGLYDVTWFRDCKPLAGTSSTYSFPSATFEDPGNYTCAINYKGMTRYIVRNQVCVKLASSRQVSVQCPDANKIKLGERFEIECVADTGTGEVSRSDYTMDFNKLSLNGTITPKFDNISCTDFLDDDNNRNVVKYNQAVSCLFKSQLKIELQCFKTPPTQESLAAERNKTNKFLISYAIESIEKLHFGQYVARITYTPFRDISSNDTFVIALKDDADVTASYLGIVLGSLAGVILLAIICFIFFIEIKWCFKHYCGAYHPAPKPYAAYIGYFFDRTIGEQQEIINLHGAIEGFLKKLDWPKFDTEQNSTDFIGHFDNIKHAQKQCDRVIILLTPDYINLKDDDFEIFAAMSEGEETPIIFITTNQTHQAIENLEQKIRAKYRGILKLNDVIKWPGSASFFKYRFFKRLELLMPKRRKQVDVPMQYRNGYAKKNIEAYENVNYV